MTADRLTAALSDRYHIEREIGQGGMATVYLAQDLKHKRKVALKVLKPELAAVLGAERFVQEITTTAALQHPHILPLFDSGTADGFLYYVMPFIDGETLRSKLDRETQLGIEESLKIATNVADALDYAHRHGVIHRDIKPENILLHEGRPMVADFGIALAVSAAAGGRMTETGLSLGTPHYMSPEQATAEKEITARSDIYSLASVLYEMLAGQPPHLGGSAQQIIMKIITETPQPVTALRKSVPRNVAAALDKALEKLPADRFASARAFAEALGNTAFTHADSVLLTGAARPVAGWRERALLPLVILGAIAIVVAVWGWSRPTRSAPIKRYHIVLPDSAPISSNFGRLALTPDGSRLIYRSSSQGSRDPQQVGDLWVRDRDKLNATKLPGTKGALVPFVSPEGGSVGFIMNRGLFTVSLRGGLPVRLSADTVGEYGATWGHDGIIYVDGDGPSGLLRVRATAGSVAESFTRLDTARGERDHVFPEVLPNGKGVLFVVRIGAFDAWEIAVADSKTGKHRALMRGVYARYSKSGHLLFVTSTGTLMAVRFDQGALRTMGEPVALSETLALRAYTRVPDLAISDDGTLIYSTHPWNVVRGEPVWVTRTGNAQPVEQGWTLTASHPAISPNGNQMALSIVDDEGQNHLWVRQLRTGAVEKLTNVGALNFRPAWFNNGDSLLFVSDRKQLSELYVDKAGDDQLLLSHPLEVSEGVMTKDGAWLVYRLGANNRSDLYARRRHGDTVAVPLATSEYLERQPAVSPDGRFLAYSSDETGELEIYMRPFPSGAGKWPISAAGGVDPLWSRDGKELFYRNGSGDLIAVEVVPGASPPVGRQRVLFSALPYSSVATHQNYDVHPDGQRFVMIRLGADQNFNAPLNVVENFFEELRRKVPR